MALARFFARTEESLLHALQLSDTTPLRQRLESADIALAFDESSLRYQNTRLTLRTIVNLFARLYPKISLVFDGGSLEGKVLLEELLKEALEINPLIEVTSQTDNLDVAICIGLPSVRSNLILYIASDGWNVELARNGSQMSLSGTIFNPVSATGAACFGVAEAFRHVFSDYLPPSDSEEHYIFSFLDYSRNLSSSTEFPGVHIEDISIVGLGAVGNAALWCLSNVPNLSGTANVIDHESVELSNLQRYILTNDASEGKSKVSIAVDALSNSAIRVIPHELKLSEYAQQRRPECDFNTIAISVDNREDRVLAQALLPRVILNGWTGDQGTIGFSRHMFDKGACLACLYPPKAKPRSYLQDLMHLTGFSKKEAYGLLYSKSPLSKEHLLRISAAKGYSMDKLQHGLGKTIEQLHWDGVCGGMLIEPSKRSDLQQRTVVPLAHQSVLAGTILAAEIIKEPLGLALPGGKEIVLDILNFPPDYAVFKVKKARSIPCICEDSDYIDRYKEKYQER